MSTRTSLQRSTARVHNTRLQTLQRENSSVVEQQLNANWRPASKCPLSILNTGILLFRATAVLGIIHRNYLLRSDSRRVDAVSACITAPTTQPRSAKHKPSPRPCPIASPTAVGQDAARFRGPGYAWLTGTWDFPNPHPRVPPIYSPQPNTLCTGSGLTSPRDARLGRVGHPPPSIFVLFSSPRSAMPLSVSIPVNDR